MVVAVVVWQVRLNDLLIKGLSSFLRRGPNNIHQILRGAPFFGQKIRGAKKEFVL